MYIIVGLGNPGQKYQNNRHNVGQMFVDYLATCNTQLVTLKTHTYMNQSGIAVKKYVTGYKLQVTDDLIVAHDDLDIPLGKFKIQKGQGPRLHNGINSIENSLGTNDFWRIRIGVDNRKPDNWINGEEYVLSDFREEERKVINSTFPMLFTQFITLFQLDIPT